MAVPRIKHFFLGCLILFPMPSSQAKLLQARKRNDDSPTSNKEIINKNIKLILVFLWTDCDCKDYTYLIHLYVAFAVLSSGSCN